MSKSKVILVVDDEPAMRRNIVDLLSADGYITFEAGDGLSAIELVKSNNPALILLDINLPKMDGISSLIEIKKINPDIPVIIFTAYGTSERAIEAMKSGAFDYMEKPFDIEEFKMAVYRALNYGDLCDEVKQLKSKIINQEVAADEPMIIGRSVKMQQIFKLIGKVASTEATVLIEGESGTGKELVADAIQRHSLRNKRPFIKVNCGGLPETLLESEMFGHEKGAFTGAVNSRQGRFELADDGTIFLDEINNMSQALQVRLLRVLQNHSFERVGGKQTIQVDVRVIAASNKNIEAEVKEGRFREDLFYRLNVVRITIPPLREHPEDIPLLVNHFLKKYNPTGQIIVSSDAMFALTNYHWPGNVRELENIIHSAVVMARENIITPDLFPSKLHGSDEIIAVDEKLKKGESLNEILDNIERTIMLRTLEENNWSRTQTAAILRINRRQLYAKMKQYGLEKRK
ncbi:MAG: sigma-54-dependent Fis family transcriptional regulator [Ignavibacteriales bacterium]|nr:sigma-54-dependent Fis family transcriptional regulator [Ignavibacteriales bacterium]